MSSKTELRARKDKAALMNTGRLMERRFDREQQEHQAELNELREKLEAAEREATMAKGGGGAFKELQKELGELRVQLAETEAELTAANAERDNALAAAQGGGSALKGSRIVSQAVFDKAEADAAKVKELEDKVAELRAEIDRLTEALGTAQGQASTLSQEELAKASQATEKLKELEQESKDHVTQLSELKVKLDQVEELKLREGQRRTRQLKHAEERADRMREELITVWEASNRGQFSEAGRNKFVTRALDLEKSLQTAQKRIVQLEDKGVEGKLAATEKTAKRFYDLLNVLRVTEDEATKIIADGIDWPVKSIGPSRLVELIATLHAPRPAPAPAPAPVKPPPPVEPVRPPTPPPAPKAAPSPPPTAQEVSQIKKLEASVKDKDATIKKLEKSVTTKTQEIGKLEQDRQRLEDEVAKQKSRATLAVQEAQEKSDELDQLRDKKDKEATDVEKERTKLKNELDRQKRRAEDAMAENKKMISDSEAQFAQLEKERDEAEASLARLVERQDRTKAEHAATVQQLYGRISALEATGGSAGGAGGADAGAKALEKERAKNQADMLFVKRQVEELVEKQRIQTLDHERQVESKIKELEMLEQERDRYREELEQAKETMNRMEARVSKPMSRNGSRTASPAPSTPEKKGSKSEADDIAWLQQQKQAVVENLEKERARLEAELATQTRIAEEALMEAGTRREELAQLKSASANSGGEFDAERHRLEVELGAQATLALQRARELDVERERMAQLARQVTELEAERNGLRNELTIRASTPTLVHSAPTNAAPGSKILGAHFEANGAPSTSIDRSATGTPVSLNGSFAPFGMPGFSTAPSSAAGSPAPAPPPMITGQIRLLVEHLRKTNRDLNQEVLSLKDENTTLMMRLAGL